MRASASPSFRPLVIAGLPRCGTTLLSTFLAAQPGCTFITDYLGSFTDALGFLGVGWSTSLDLTQRRVALAKVRDQLLRFRHPVLVRPEAFATVAELHEAVLAELAQPDDLVVGHKLVLDAPDVEAMLQHTPCSVVVLYRDPRDAALSWYHRTGGGVEGYVERWRAMVRFLTRTSSPRLFAVRYEDMVEAPARTLTPLFEAVGLPLSVGHAELVFRGPGGRLPFRGNAGTGDERRAFDTRAVGTWRERSSSPLVRYVDAVTSREQRQLGYPAGPATPRSERTRWQLHRAAHLASDRADAWWKRGRTELLARLAPPLRADSSGP
jgi:hypothetical protein